MFDMEADVMGVTHLVDKYAYTSPHVEIRTGKFHEDPARSYEKWFKAIDLKGELVMQMENELYARIKAAFFERDPLWTNADVEIVGCTDYVTRWEETVGPGGCVASALMIVRV
jgi:hypothetical protein